MADRRALGSLLNCLRGHVPSDIDWQSVIAVSNRTLTTGTLAYRLREGDHWPWLPGDVQTFLSAIHERTALRNDRLSAQLDEAVLCLNGAGITPILLKGAALQRTCHAAGGEGRLLSDLDLMVPVSTMPYAIACLARIGYRLQSDDIAPESASVLYRECDVGMIDLHCRMKPPRPRIGHDDLASACAPVAIGEGMALLPSPTAQALILILHDQLQDRDYWRGLIDMRHLLDLDVLARTPQGIDWNRLLEYFPVGYPRTALLVQLFTARQLLATPVPVDLVRGWRPRFQYWRRMTQARWPVLMAPMTYLTLALDPPRFHAGPHVGVASEGPSPRAGAVDRLMGTLRRFMRQKAPGKV